MGSLSVLSCRCCMFVSCVHPVAVLKGLCACTEMLWICVLYVSFGSKVRPRTFGCLPWVVFCCLLLGPDCSIFCRVWCEQSCFVWI